MAHEAIRSVTHLVLAPLGPMPAEPQFRTERSGPDVSCPAPSGSVFLVTVLLPPAPALASRCATDPAPNPASGGIQKTFSAGPCSFSFQELWFAAAACASASNPFLTHGTVESPSKLSLRHI